MPNTSLKIRILVSIYSRSKIIYSKITTCRNFVKKQTNLLNLYKCRLGLIAFGLYFYQTPVHNLPPIHISPDQYLHKFVGRVTVEELRPWPGVLSVAQISPGLCRISIMPKSEVGEKIYECLYLVELANCNGAFDVNADPHRIVVPTGYERTCDSANWSSIYNQLVDTNTQM